MASDSVKNSTAPKSKKQQERVRAGDKELDGGVLDEDYYLRGNTDRFGYNSSKEDAEALRRLIEESAPKPRMTPEEMQRAVPDTNPITHRDRGYRDSPHKVSPQDMGSYRAPLELLTEEEMIMQFLHGGKQI